MFLRWWYLDGHEAKQVPMDDEGVPDFAAVVDENYSPTVAEDIIAGVRISTVLLPADCLVGMTVIGPCFETMIFSPGSAHVVSRVSTYGQALQVHALTVQQVIREVTPPLN